MSAYAEFREKLLEHLDDRMAERGFRRRRHAYVRWMGSGVAHAVSVRMMRYEPGDADWNLRYSSYGEVEVDVGVYSRAMAGAEGDEVRSFPTTAWQVSRGLGEFIGRGIHHRWPLVGEPGDLADELWGLLASEAIPWLDGLPDDDALVAWAKEVGDRYAWRLQTLLHLDRGEAAAAAVALRRYLEELPEADRERLADWYSRKYQLDLS